MPRNTSFWNVQWARSCTYEFSYKSYLWQWVPRLPILPPQGRTSQSEHYIKT